MSEELYPEGTERDMMELISGITFIFLCPTELQMCPEAAQIQYIQLLMKRAAHVSETQRFRTTFKTGK